MKNKDLLDAMNDIDDKYIKEAEHNIVKKRLTGARFRKAGIAAACLCVLAGGILAVRSFFRHGSASDSGNGFIIAQASYPERLQYPEIDWYDNSLTDADMDAYFKHEKEWRNNYRERTIRSADYLDALYPFYKTTMRQLLVSTENENRVYSPLNLYIALSMLAELTDGESRAQILTLLSADSVDALHKSIPALWDANYTDDGAVTSLLANSLWLREDISYIPSTLKTLAETYRASSFRGDMASEEYTRALQTWLSEQTGGLLDKQAGQIELNPNTVLALASTIYFRAKWDSQFYSSRTKESIFHAASGDITCDFMNQEENRPYYYGDGFSAIYQSFQYSGGMWLVLPEEGTTVNDLVLDGQILDLVRNNNDWEGKAQRKVNLSMPKFDVISDINLSGHLKALGVTDIFLPEISDFSPMTKDVDQVFVSQATHAARVTVDEDGCTATAFTVLAMDGAGVPPENETVDFILDRPFLFLITGADNSILFAGIVEQP